MERIMYHQPTAKQNLEHTDEEINLMDDKLRVLLETILQTTYIDFNLLEIDDNISYDQIFNYYEQ